MLKTLFSVFALTLPTITFASTETDRTIALDKLEGCSYCAYWYKTQRHMSYSCEYDLNQARMFDASEAEILRAIRSGISRAKVRIAENEAEAMRDAPIQRAAGKSFEKLMAEAQKN